MNDADPHFFDKMRRQEASSSSVDSEPNQSVAHETLPQNDTQTPTSHPAMPPDARRALVYLLRQGVVLADRNLATFESICRYQKGLRAQLANMYLELTLDEKMGIAFVRSVDANDADINEQTPDPHHIETHLDDEPVSLITRRTLTLFDTLLLLVLRKHYQERETSGEQKVIIDIERVESNMSPFLALTNSTASERRRLGTAMKKMTEKRILNTIRGSEDRFEITPLIRYVVNAAFLETMLSQYHQLAKEAGVELDDQADSP